MKKIIGGLLILALMFGTAACGASQAKETDMLKETTAVKETVNINEPIQGQTVFEQFESGLVNAGIKFEKITMFAEMIGAEEGVKYTLSTGNVEIYRFDPNGEAFEEVSRNKSVNVDGFGSFAVEVYGNYAVFDETSGEEQQKVQAIIDKISF